MYFNNESQDAWIIPLLAMLVYTFVLKIRVKLSSNSIIYLPISYFDPLL